MKKTIVIPPINNEGYHETLNLDFVKVEEIECKYIITFDTMDSIMKPKWLG
jgi:hypothetical protein